MSLGGNIVDDSGAGAPADSPLSRGVRQRGPMARQGSGAFHTAPLPPIEAVAAGAGAAVAGSSAEVTLQSVPACVKVTQATEASTAPEAGGSGGDAGCETEAAGFNSHLTEVNPLLAMQTSDLMMAVDGREVRAGELRKEGVAAPWILTTDASSVSHRDEYDDDGHVVI